MPKLEGSVVTDNLVVRLREAQLSRQAPTVLATLSPPLA
jgi:hypothetical protein